MVSGLRDCGDPLSCLLALGGTMERVVCREPLGNAHDLTPEHPQLRLNRPILDLAGLVEDTRG